MVVIMPACCWWLGGFTCVLCMYCMTPHISDEEVAEEEGAPEGAEETEEQGDADADPALKQEY